MTVRHLARSLAAACLGLALLGAPGIAHAAPVAPAAETAPAAAPATQAAKPTTDDDDTAQRYAARESSAPQAAGFKGQGAGIYIGGSTAAVVLLIVLVVILL